jgi:hypothetical protein
LHFVPQNEVVPAQCDIITQETSCITNKWRHYEVSCPKESSKLNRTSVHLEAICNGRQSQYHLMIWGISMRLLSDCFQKPEPGSISNSPLVSLTDYFPCKTAKMTYLRNMHLLIFFLKPTLKNYMRPKFKCVLYCKYVLVIRYHEHTQSLPFRKCMWNNQGR